MELTFRAGCSVRGCNGPLPRESRPTQTHEQGMAPLIEDTLLKYGIERSASRHVSSSFRSCACPLEVIRCVLLFILDGYVFHLGMPGSQIVGPGVLITFAKGAYALSLTGAFVECLRGIRVTDNRMKAN